MSVSDAERRLERGDEHEVTPLELFFDLTFVMGRALRSRAAAQAGRDDLARREQGSGAPHIRRQ